ncbi:MAG: universal stress protein [Planctomycetes bacterium]|nr:universal stress protein [Planctomycetota bacterium]
MFKRILVATDGSPFSHAAFDVAVFLAQAFKNSLIYGLHVIDIKMLAGPFLHDLGVSVGLGPFDSYQPRVRQMLQEKGEMALNDGADLCRNAGIEYEPHLAEGIVSREILARAAGCDVVVMGKLGEHAPWRSALLGHNTEAVCRTSHHPVLVATEKFTTPARALLAYDGSSHAYDAMHAAGEIIEKIRVPLLVLSSHPDLAEAEKKALAGQRYLRRYGAEVEALPTTEHPEDAILRVARERQCGLILMGAYGHTRIRELILGSTTEHVMRRAECPLLLHR